jgi:hypothetical protein
VTFVELAIESGFADGKLPFTRLQLSLRENDQQLAAGSGLRNMRRSNHGCWANLCRQSEPVAATGAAQSTLGASEESCAGTGERSRRSHHSLSRPASRLPRTEGGFYSAGRGKDCPFPRAPIPEPYAISSSPTYSPSSLATRLAANENTGFFLGLVKPQPGDISIVDKPGTLLMWYDRLLLFLLTPSMLGRTIRPSTHTVLIRLLTLVSN